MSRFLSITALIVALSFSINNVFGATCDFFLFNSGIPMQADTCMQFTITNGSAEAGLSYELACDSSGNSGTYNVYLSSDVPAPCSGTAISSTSYDFDVFPLGVCNSGLSNCDVTTIDYEDYDEDDCDGLLEIEGSWDCIKETQCIEFTLATNIESFDYKIDGSGVLITGYEDDSCSNEVNSTYTVLFDTCYSLGDDSEYYTNSPAPTKNQSFTSIFIFGAVVVLFNLF